MKCASFLVPSRTLPKFLPNSPPGRNGGGVSWMLSLRLVAMTNMKYSGRIDSTPATISATYVSGLACHMRREADLIGGPSLNRLADEQEVDHRKDHDDEEDRPRDRRPVAVAVVLERLGVHVHGQRLELVGRAARGLAVAEDQRL